ncbi:DUF3987 domain-containing protein [Streptomyces alkaliterrae]|uniref:DUF3987 domain-containing protein n=1 Tax=Streptomyces alkaliterrae TaxID=2213162 RepID=UPI001E3E9DE6|nr:DUF3987 domain-containing protein [Streptomyces alkaliterrae]
MVIHPAALDLPHALVEWVTMLIVAREGDRRRKLRPSQRAMDAAGSLALSVLATAAGGRSVVQVRGRWREPVNLYVVVALPPANRKSAVFSAMTAPLYEAESEGLPAPGPRRRVLEHAWNTRAGRQRDTRDTE